MFLLGVGRPAWLARKAPGDGKNGCPKLGVGETALPGLVLRRGAAVVSVEMNPGKVFLFGIRPQHRAQTHATFGLLFNALYWSAEGDVKVQ